LDENYQCLIQEVKPLLVYTIELIQGTHIISFDSVPAGPEEGANESVRSVCFLLRQCFNCFFQLLVLRKVDQGGVVAEAATLAPQN
jgi:hypothetical protein